MKETPDESYTFFSDDEQVTVPLYSLYSERREPNDQQLAQIDTFVVDLPDIGCRYVSFAKFVSINGAKKFKPDCVPLKQDLYFHAYSCCVSSCC